MHLKELARHALADGTIGIVAVARPERQLKTMRGWTRVDPRPWTKLSAKWRRDDGAMELHHCGHPTALFPWMLFDAEGKAITPRKFATLDVAIGWIHVRSSRSLRGRF